MTNLTLTQSKNGDYRFHRDTCKKIEGRPTYSIDEVAEDGLDALEAATAASCCKPPAAMIGEIKSNLGVQVDDEAGVTPAVEDTAQDNPEPDSDDTQDPETEEADDMTADDEDLLGTEPSEVETKPKPKATPGTPERSPEGREMEVVAALAGILDIELTNPDQEFPGHGKAIKVKGGGSLYLNSKHFADIRAKDLETARAWVQEGYGTARGGNYVRVSVKGL